MFEQFSKFAVENLESLLSLIYGYLFETVWIMLGKRGFKKWTMGFKKKKKKPYLKLFLGQKMEGDLQGVEVVEQG
jgi:hypothetical protein